MNTNLRSRRTFYGHLAAFVGVNLLLFVSDVANGGGWSFYSTFLIWGAFLVLHWWLVFYAGSDADIGEKEKRAANATENRNTPQRFYIHLAVYTGVNLLLFILDASDGGAWWFYFPLIGWGIAVVVHAIQTFGPGQA